MCLGLPRGHRGHVGFQVRWRPHARGGGYVVDGAGGSGDRSVPSLPLLPSGGGASGRSVHDHEEREQTRRAAAVPSPRSLLLFSSILSPAPPVPIWRSQNPLLLKIMLACALPLICCPYFILLCSIQAVYFLGSLCFGPCVRSRAVRGPWGSSRRSTRPRPGRSLAPSFLGGAWARPGGGVCPDRLGALRSVPRAVTSTSFSVCCVKAVRLVISGNL